MLKFDDDGKRYLENGVDHGILFVFNKNSKNYNAGVEWNGLTSVSQNPEGAENEDVYADNMKYASLTSAETFGATINAYTYPDEFEACDGNAAANGMSIGQQKRVPFAFAYRTNITNDQDMDGHILHIVYGAKASPSEREYSTTTDSPEGLEMSWEVSTTPVSVTGTFNGEAVRPVAHAQIFSHDKSTGEATTWYPEIEALLNGGSSVAAVQTSAYAHYNAWLESKELSTVTVGTSVLPNAQYITDIITGAYNPQQ